MAGVYFPTRMDGLHALLQGSIDYAGLFPPAGLDMAAAVANYADYRRSPDRWALGRFVVPSGRLGELETAAADLAPSAPSSDAWPLAVLLTDAGAEEIRALGEFNCRHAAEGAPALSGDVVEVKADSVAAIERIAAAVPRYLQAYIEVPIGQDPSPLIAAVGRAGARAKVRTGGITPDAFPSAQNLARFFRACADVGVAFKATAGLHHPLRAEYRLTYRPDSASGDADFNLFLAAAFIHEDEPGRRGAAAGSATPGRFASRPAAAAARPPDRGRCAQRAGEGILRPRPSPSRWGIWGSTL
jgi:hypothetical protein